MLKSTGADASNEYPMDWPAASFTHSSAICRGTITCVKGFSIVAPLGDAPTTTADRPTPKRTETKLTDQRIRAPSRFCDGRDCNAAGTSPSQETSGRARLRLQQ